MATVDGAARLRVVEVFGLSEPVAAQLYSHLDYGASYPLGMVGFANYFEKLWDSSQAAAPDGTAATNVFSLFLEKLMGQHTGYKEAAQGVF